LKEALAAASREDHDGRGILPAAGLPVAEGAPAVIALAPATTPKAEPAAIAAPVPMRSGDALPPPISSAEEAARAVRASVTLRREDRHVEPVEPPTTRVVRKPADVKATAAAATDAARTRLVRGRQKLDRSGFSTDPVVAWLVVVGGPGLGAFRPVFEGNNTLGRATTNRIAIDFGDDAISAEDQAYIRYDSADRSFLFVPNLAKTNVVSVNDKRPTGAVDLAHMDVITMGRTQLVFVPFCGEDFDWSALAEVKD
jgi:hypothetical protein